MKLAIIGSRTFNDKNLLCSSIKELEKETNQKVEEIVSGGAQGADKLGETYANENNLKKKIFYANWNDMTEPCIKKKGKFGEYNALAGINRNTLIIEYSDYILAFWDGSSKGTLDSINKSKKLNKNIKIIYF